MPLAYMSGFGNSFETETLPGALPVGRNSPQKVGYGLYAEQLSGTPFTAPRAANQRSWLYRIRPGVRHMSRFRKVDPGLVRTAPDREAAKQGIDALVQTLSPKPRVIGGKCVVNLLPANAADKFDALLALQRHEGAGNALFIGDDETDENVFRRALPDWLTIRVGHETPSAAAYCLNSQNEMAPLIQRIDSMIRAKTKEST